MSPFDSPLALRQPLVFASRSQIPFPLFSHHSQAGGVPHLLKSGSARELCWVSLHNGCLQSRQNCPSSVLKLGYSAGTLTAGLLLSCLYHFFLLLLSAPFILAIKTATFLKSDALNESCVRKLSRTILLQGLREI